MCCKSYYNTINCCREIRLVVKCRANEDGKDPSAARVFLFIAWPGHYALQIRTMTYITVCHEILLNIVCSGYLKYNTNKCLVYKLDQMKWRCSIPVLWVASDRDDTSMTFQFRVISHSFMCYSYFFSLACCDHVVEMLAFMSHARPE